MQWKTLIEKEEELVRKMRTGDTAAFEEIYRHYWEDLFRYLYNRLHYHAVSEEIVQEIFLSLWEKRSSLTIHTSLSSYLFRAARYRMLNHIRAEKVRESYAADFLEAQISLISDPMGPQLRYAEDLKNIIEEKLCDLPPKCQTVFRMSRQQHIPNQEIAEELKISKKTVENYLTIALRHLRMHLAEYMTSLMLFSVMF